MRISTALLVFSLVAWLPVQAASALQWHAYGGHSYALTTNFGTWQSAEAEAVATACRTQTRPWGSGTGDGRDRGRAAPGTGGTGDSVRCNHCRTSGVLW